MTLDDTLKERGDRYGRLVDNGAISQAIKAVMRFAPKWDSLAPDQQEALDNFAQKVARILTGDPDYPDNWHDIQGYAKLVEERLLHPVKEKV